MFRGDNAELMLGFGRQADLNRAVGGVKPENDARRLEVFPFENGDDIGFPDARGMDHAYEPGAHMGIAFLKPRNDLFVEDGVELVGRAGQNKQHFTAGQLDALAGRRAGGVGQDHGRFEHLRLPCGRQADGPPAFLVPFLELFDGGLVEHDFLLEPFGEGIAGDVVDGGAEAPADEDEVGAGDGFLGGRTDGMDFVGDGGVAYELEAHRGEGRAQVAPVRVERAAAQEFVTDRYEFCLIVHCVLLKMRGNTDGMNELNQSLSVDESAAKTRLDAFLAAAVAAVSRSHWKTLIQDGLVLVNGASCKPNHKLKAGDEVAWSIPDESPVEALPEDIPLDVLFEDEAVLVLNKPPGLVVHPAAGNESGTLVNALLFHDSVFKSVERAGMVHRLDKDTSGVMVVAKTAAALAELQRQFKARETGKEYLALVWRHPPARGRIENLIGRHPVHRKKMAVLKEGGRGAVSSFEVQETFAEAALVRVKIETGRTHQIRVHMAHLGHPIVGDSVYGRARKQKLPVDAQRQMLHAFRLEFTHPATGKRLSFEAPLFDDMRHLLELLRD